MQNTEIRSAHPLFIIVLIEFVDFSSMRHIIM